jgi:DNA-binding transcriptional LysR family regulator
MLRSIAHAEKYNIYLNPYTVYIVELRQLRHFIALAETLNFSRAAERMHIAQPPLSISIRKLEEELGVRLFERGPRHVALTRAGNMALASARQALSCVAETTRVAQATAAGEAGVLRVAFVGGATFRLFPQRLPEFRLLYPAVELELSEATSNQAVEKVSNGSSDVGILRYPLAQATSLAVHVLEQDRLAAVLPENHRLARRDSLQLKELAGEDFVMYSHAQAPSMHAIVALACRHAGFSPRVAQEAVQIQTIISLVQSGLGIALVPASCQQSLGQHVAFRRLTDREPLLGVGLALVADATRNDPLVQNFLKVLSASPAVGRRSGVRAKRTGTR